MRRCFLFFLNTLFCTVVRCGAAELKTTRCQSAKVRPIKWWEIFEPVNEKQFGPEYLGSQLRAHLLKRSQVERRTALLPKSWESRPSQRQGQLMYIFSSNKHSPLISVKQRQLAQISRGNFLLEIPLWKHLGYQKVSLVERTKKVCRSFFFFFPLNLSYIKCRKGSAVAVISCS